MSTMTKAQSQCGPLICQQRYRKHGTWKQLREPMLAHPPHVLWQLAAPLKAPHCCCSRLDCTPTLLPTLLFFSLLLLALLLHLLLPLLLLLLLPLPLPFPLLLLLLLLLLALPLLLQLRCSHCCQCCYWDGLSNTNCKSHHT